MKARKNMWCIVALAAMLVALIPVQSLAAQGGASVEDAITEIDAFLNRMVEDDSFSGSVLIARGDEVLLSQGYGLANRDWDIPNTPQTKFRIHKLTMQFTGMAILMLQERGLLSVDDPICQYLEDCPEAWQDITIYHLLTHSSGIDVVPRNTNFDYALGNRRTTLNLIKQDPLYFVPGEDMSWSDAGYWLLGEIIDEASGSSYNRFLKENIFEPLGMNDTDYDTPYKIVPQRAEGYTATFLRRADLTNMQAPYAAGGLYSTVEDLHKWEQALFNGEVVSTETWDAMIANAYSFDNLATGTLPSTLDWKNAFGLDTDMPGSYGYGLAIGYKNGRPAVVQPGWGGSPGPYSGFQSYMAHFTDDDLTIIILSNLESAIPSMLADIMVAKLLDEALYGG